MDRRISGPGVTFRQEPRRPFNWAPVLAIVIALLGAAVLGLAYVLPLILQAPIR